MKQRDDAEIEYEIAMRSMSDADFMEMYCKNAQRIVKLFDISVIEGTVEKTYGKSPVEMAQEYMGKYPTWANTVEGSIVEPITDEKRLLE